MNSTLGAVEADLAALLNRPLAQVQAFERSAFDSIAGSDSRRLVLCGAGGLGRRTLAGLRSLGIEPLAFADANAKLWGGRIDGLEVLSPEIASARHGRDALFVVTVWGAQGSDSMLDRVRWWRAAGCGQVITFLPLYWKYPRKFLPFWGCDLPSRTLQDAARVSRVGQLWSDDASREEYVKQVKWRLDGDFGPLAIPAPGTMYFSPPFARLRPDENFVDCGAFDGDTLRDFLAATEGKFQRYTAIEPDPENFRRLVATADRSEASVRNRIRVLPFAAHWRQERLKFSASGSLSSAVGATGDMEVQGDTLDRILADETPSFIKLDIEGAEIDALQGALRVLVRTRPLVAVSSYHRQSHLWEIPELLASTLSNYSFFLVPHVRDGWDLVCYAVPTERLDR